MKQVNLWWKFKNKKLWIPILHNISKKKTSYFQLLLQNNTQRDEKVGQV